MESNYLIGIIIFLIISGIFFIYTRPSTFGNIEEIGKTVYQTQSGDLKSISGHIPGSYLGLSDSEKRLLFHKFINNGESI